LARQERLRGTPFASVTILALLGQNSVASTLLARLRTSLLMLYRYSIASVAVLALLVQNSVASTLLVQLLKYFTSTITY